MRRPDARAWLIGATWAAFALRVFRLGYQELRGDEAFGYFFLQSSYGQIIRDTVDLAEPHPVASYFVQKAWLSIAGNSEFAQRFSGAWFSVLAVALLYRLARRLRLPSLPSAAGAVLLAFSPYAIWHSQDARMYSMLLALITASAWLALASLDALAARGHGSLPWWLAYVAVTWLALHTHYSAAFVLVAENLCVFGLALARRRGRLLLPWIAAQAALALLYAPWLLRVAGNLSAYSGNGDSPGLPAMLYRSFSALAFGESVPVTVRPWLGGLAALVAAAGLAGLLLRPATRLAGGWLAVNLLAPLAATWISGMSRPIFNERYLVAAVPPFYLLLAAGLAGPWLTREDEHEREAPAQAGAGAVAWSGVAMAALCLIVAATGVSLANHYANPAYAKTHGWRALSAEISRLAGSVPEDEVRIAENYPDPTLWYYYAGPLEHVMLPPAPGDAPAAREEVDRLAAEGVRWVLLPVLSAGDWDPDGIASAALATRYTLVARSQAGSWPLELYVRPDPAALVRVGQAFANGVTLAAAGVEPAAPDPGGVLVVHLAWEGSAAGLRGTEKLFLHLADAQGVPVAQLDPPFGAAQLGKTSTYGLALPAGLPPGRYQILAGIYDPGQAQAPRLPLAGGGDHVVLGQVERAGG